MNRRGILNMYVGAAIILLALFFVWGIARNWSCRKRRPPRPPVQHMFTVDSVTTGASILCKRGRRTRLVMLADIFAPSVGEPFHAESRANLEQLAGKQIRVVHVKRRMMSEDQDEFFEERFGAWMNKHRISCEQCRLEPPEVLCETAAKKAMEMLKDSQAASKHIMGIVYGESGACLNLAQVQAGWAYCLISAKKEWKQAQNEAVHAERGMWTKEKKR